MNEFPFSKILVPIFSTGIECRDYLRNLQAVSGAEVLYVYVTPAGANGKLAIAERYSIPAEQLHVRHGNVLDELLAAAAELHADLILLGDHQSSGRHRSFARRLAMQAPCSVWMVPDRARPVVSKILVPVDFSDCSSDAVRTASRIAACCHISEITGLHVYFDDATVTYEGHSSVALEREGISFQRFLFRSQHPNAVFHPLTIENPHVAETILRVAREGGYDLIVMGTRGRSQSAAALLGSETDRTFSDSTIPTLGVKHFGARIGLLEAILDRRFHRREEAHFS